MRVQADSRTHKAAAAGVQRPEWPEVILDETEGLEWEKRCKGDVVPAAPRYSPVPGKPLDEITASPRVQIEAVPRLLFSARGLSVAASRIYAVCSKELGITYE